MAEWLLPLVMWVGCKRLGTLVGKCLQMLSEFVACRTRDTCRQQVSVALGISLFIVSGQASFRFFGQIPWYFSCAYVENAFMTYAEVHLSLKLIMEV